MSLSESNLYNCFAGCLVPQTIHQNESLLKSFQQDPDFVPVLLSLISKGIPDLPILNLAVTVYKKHLLNRYNNPQNPMPQPSRELVRITLIDIYFSIKSSDVAVSIYKQICEIVIMVSFTQLDPHMTDIKKVEAYVYFYRQVAKAYEYLMDPQNRGVFEKFLHAYFPVTEGILQQLMQNYNNETAKLLFQLLKMFASSIHMMMPDYLRDFSHMEKWIMYFKTIMDAPIVANTPQEEASFWRNKIQVTHIFVKMFCGYFSPMSDTIRFPGWSAQFAEKYSFSILASCMPLFKACNNSYVHEDVLANIIKLFQFSLKNQYTRNLLLPGFEGILFDYLFPLMELKESDIKLFQNDPEEYIRRDEDLTVNRVKRISSDLIQMLVHFSHDNKSFLIRIIEYAAVSLKDPNVSSLRKEAILMILGKLKNKIMGNEFIKKEFSKFTAEYFVPFLKSQQPILLAAVCDVIERYISTIVPDQATIQLLVSELYNCLLQGCFVVRFKAILAFTALLSHKQAAALTQPHFSEILKIYVKMINHFDHESLLKALEIIGETFTAEIGTVGDQLIKHLVSMFYKYSTSTEKDAEDEEQLDSQNNATAAISTISQILKADMTPQMYLDVSGDLIEMYVYVLQNKLDYLDEAVSLISVLVYHAKILSDPVFLYVISRKQLEGVNYPCPPFREHTNIVEKVEKAEDEFHDELLSILKNLIRIPQVLNSGYPFPSHPHLLLCLIQNKLVAPEQLLQLDTSQINLVWGNVLQSYSKMIYGVGSVIMTLDAIKGVPKGVSLAPWIMNVNDQSLLIAIIRKVINRISEDEDEDEEDEETSAENSNTLQMLEKYAKENEEDDVQYGEDDQLYSYRYDSPYQPAKDINLLKKLLVTMDNTNTLLSQLTNNQVEKLKKLIDAVQD